MAAPNKPTQPFGHINFSKDGRVTKHVRRLSSVKEDQEREVATYFVEDFNSLYTDRPITNLVTLGQDNNDFAAQISGGPLILEITELVGRSYLVEMTREEYDRGGWAECVYGGPDAVPRRVDRERRDNELWRVIENKLPRYAPPKRGALWLIVFTTQSDYLTEHNQGGASHQSEALRRARNRVAESGINPFSEIWFTNMETRPIQIWPTNVSTVTPTASPGSPPDR